MRRVHRSAHCFEIIVCFIFVGLCWAELLLASVPPVLGPAPSGIIAFRGTSITLDIQVSGDPAPINQWRRNGIPIEGMTAASMPITLTMADSGAYTIQSRNIAGSVVSSPAVNIVVVDNADIELPVVAGRTAQIRAPTLTTNATFHWQKNGAEIELSPRISGINAYDLVIAQTVDTDAGVYTCTITTTDGSLTGGAIHLVPVLRKPVIMEPITMYYNPSVAADFYMDVEADFYPDKFTITGLPSGLGYDTKNGVIKGVPREPGTFRLKITATNALGTSEAAYFDLTVDPLPAWALGSMSAVIDNDATYNDELGGQTSLTMSRTGAFTGNITLGTRSYPISGRLYTNPDSDAAQRTTIKINRRGLPPYYLDIGVDTSTASVTGFISEQPLQQAFGYSSWRWLPTTSSVYSAAGYYTFSAEDGRMASGVSNVGSFALGKTGSLSGVLRLLDGTAITLGGRLSTSLTTPVFKVLYGGTGSICGFIGIDSREYSAPETAAVGSMRWFKNPATKFTRSWASGFNAQLAPTGYGWPAGELAAYARQRYGIMSWADFDTAVTVRSGTGSFGRIFSDANPIGWQRFSVSGSTGLFSGSGTNRYVPDPDSAPRVYVDRRFSAFGMLVRDRYNGIYGAGYLHMVDLADPDIPTTLSTSPILHWGVMYSASNGFGEIGSYQSSGFGSLNLGGTSGGAILSISGP